MGYFLNDKINVDNSLNKPALSEFSFSRKLTNIDLSYSYKGFRLLAEYFGLSGDLINLEATSKENIIGNSGGYYAQIEYAFNKWSPYVIYESFDKNRSSNNALQNITTVGLNFYQRLEATRFGIAHKTIVNGKDIGDNTSESLYLYAMLNF